MLCAFSPLFFSPSIYSQDMSSARVSFYGDKGYGKVDMPLMTGIVGNGTSGAGGMLCTKAGLVDCTSQKCQVVGLW